MYDSTFIHSRNLHYREFGGSLPPPPLTFAAHLIYVCAHTFLDVAGNVFIYSLIHDIDFIMVIADDYLDKGVCLYFPYAWTHDGQCELRL